MGVPVEGGTQLRVSDSGLLSLHTIHLLIHILLLYLFSVSFKSISSRRQGFLSVLLKAVFPVIRTGLAIQQVLNKNTEGVND